MKKLLSLLILGLLCSSQLYGMEKITKKRALTEFSNSDEELNENEQMTDATQENIEKDLNKAISKKNYKEINNLLAKIPNLSEKEAFKPFINAIETGNIELVNLFLEKNVCLTHSTKTKFWPLVSAVQTKNLEIVKLLHDKITNSCFEQRNAAFITACALDCVEIAQYLLSCGADINCIIFPNFLLSFFKPKKTKSNELTTKTDLTKLSAKAKVSALGLAAYLGNLATVKFLLNNPTIQINHKTCESTPLALAIEGKYDEIINLLLARKPELRVPKVVETAFHAAIKTKRPDIIKQLINLNPTKAKKIIEEEEYILALALNSGIEEIISLILPFYETKKLSLSVIAAKCGNQKLMEHFRPEDESDFYTLMLRPAIEENQIELVKFLLAHGANPKYKKNEYEQSLTIVAQNKPEILKLLIDHGAAVNSLPATPFYQRNEKSDLLVDSQTLVAEQETKFIEACNNADVEQAKNLAFHMDRFKQNKLEILFDQAVNKNQLDIVNLLLKSLRIRPNNYKIKMNYNFEFVAELPSIIYCVQDALHFAARTGNLELLKMLIPYADKNPEILQAAIEGSNIEVIKALIDAGYSVNDNHISNAKLLTNKLITSILQDQFEKQKREISDLFTAIAKGNQAAVAQFFNKNFDLLASNPEKTNILEAAVISEQKDMVRFLEKIIPMHNTPGKSVKNDMFTQALLQAVKQQSVAMVKCLLETFEPLYIAEHLMPALELAASEGYNDLLKEIEQKYKLKARHGNNVQYFLMIASIKNNDAVMIKDFLKSKTKRKLLNKFGFSDLLNQTFFKHPIFKDAIKSKYSRLIQGMIASTITDDIKYIVQLFAELNKTGIPVTFLFAANCGATNIMQAIIEDGYDCTKAKNEALLCATANGHLDTINFLISKGFTLDEIIARRMLKIAIAAKHINIIDFILSLYPKFLEFACIKEFLPIALANDDSKVLNFLIKQYKGNQDELFNHFDELLMQKKFEFTADNQWCADFLGKNNLQMRQNILTFVSQFGDLEFYQHLLQNISDRKQALDLTLACPLISPKILEFVIAQKANINFRVNNGCTPIERAVISRNWVSAIALLRAGADITQIEYCKKFLENDPLATKRLQEILSLEGSRKMSQKQKLFDAIKANDATIIENLIEQNADLCCTDELGYTPLMLACKFGHDEIVRVLLNANVPIDAKLKDSKQTALYFAVDSQNSSTVKILLERAATDENFEAITYAIELGNKDIVKLMLSYSFAKPELRSQALLAASKYGNFEIAHLMIEQGADINVLNENGSTPLMSAAQAGHKELVTLLLEQKANIRIKDKEGKDAFVYASGNEEISYALTHALNSNGQKITALVTAIVANDFNSVRDIVLSANIDINMQDAKGLTPLMYAVKTCNHALTNYLQYNGANGNIMDQSNKSVLDYAVFACDAQLLSDLLKNGRFEQNTIKQAIKFAALNLKSKQNNSKLLDILMVAVAPEVKQEALSSVVTAALETNNEQLVEKMLNQMNTVSQENADAWMDSAIKTGNKNIIRLIVSKASLTKLQKLAGVNARQGKYDLMALLIDSPTIGIANQVTQQHLARWSLFISQLLGKQTIEMKKTAPGALNPLIKFNFEEVLVLINILLDEKCNDYLVLHGTPNFLETIMQLAEKSDADSLSKLQKTIKWACIFGHLDTIKTLIELPLEYFIKKDEFGRTPLIYAILYGNIDCLKILIDKCKNVGINLCDNECNNALFYGIIKGSMESLYHLFRNGANFITDEKLLLALKIAAENGHARVAARILLKLKSTKAIVKNKDAFKGLDWHE